MTQLSITLFGAFEVRRDDRPITTLTLAAARALLAYLLLDAPAWHSRETLADLLWPNQPTARGLHSLRQALAQLRHALAWPGDPPLLEIERDRLRCRTAPAVYLDVADFTRRIAQLSQWPPFNGRSLTYRPASVSISDFVLEELQQTVELYRGDFLDDSRHQSVALEDWIRLHRERYHRQALDALYALTAAYEARGDFARARAGARRQLTMEPWGEEAYQQLMRALAFSGQRSAALEQYQRCARILKTELGVEPAASAAALYERIRDEKLAPPAPASTPPHNLPRGQTSFIGRKAELRRICTLLLDPSCSLVTLSGAGGIGKTRLALEAAARLRECFPDGSWVVPLDKFRANVTALESSNEPRQLFDALATTLSSRLNTTLDCPEQLLRTLSNKTLLLILDGFEASAAEAAFLVELLQRAPRVKALITATQRLNLRAEHLLPLEGLPVPPTPDSPGAAEYDSVQLFAACVQRNTGTFTLDSATLAGVIELCRVVEGHPLALELAASQRFPLCPL